MSDLLAGFDWTTPFIADACVQLTLPVRVGPLGLTPNIRGAKVAGREVSSQKFKVSS